MPEKIYRVILRNEERAKLTAIVKKGKGARPVTEMLNTPQAETRLSSDVDNLDV